MIKAQSKRVSSTASVQAPTGGLNARDAIADMKETEAVVMENWFPTPASVDIRKGMKTHVTGLPSQVETLALYNDSVSSSLFAFSGSGIYDVTNSGAVGAAVFSGLTDSRWQTINVGTAGGNFLMAANGVDEIVLYDGTTWKFINAASTPAITGVSTTAIASLNNFKNRVWLIEKSSLRVWYLPVSSIGGAATSLDLSTLFKLGGYIMSMANWTINNSAGIDDYAAFITSNGEVAIFQGTDPSSAATWSMVGTFRMGSPIGRRCAIKAGADVLVLTTDGAFPLSKSFLSDRSQLNLSATDKISNLINYDVLQYRDNFGWQAIIHPIGNKLILNVPTTEGTISHQYVMNTTHGAWTKFIGWNANCWETMNDQLFYGSSGIVYEAETGQSDDGADINSVCQQAFSYFGSKGVLKKFQMAQVIALSDGDLQPSVLINVDFNQNRTTVPPSFTGNVGSEWDVSSWDVSAWTSGDNILKRWQTITGLGFAGGLRIVTQSQNLSYRWQATNFIFEKGGVL